MTKLEAKKRINKLKKLINYHRHQYHVFDKQEISDNAFDSLKHELYKLEQSFPELITLDSPTQKVGGQPLKKFKKRQHQTPMLSLEDVFSRKELEDWQSYLRRLAPDKVLEYFCELKVDGFAVTLIYEKGVFACGATRGDGRIGEDVTENLKTIKSIPFQTNKMKDLPAKLEIRGEVYMEKKDFEQTNKKLDNKYSNPRNLAAGSIRQLNPKLAASRPLKFLAYDIITDMGYKNHSQEHQALSLMGFKTDKGKVCQNLFQVFDYWQKTFKKREFLSFQIDGIVVNVNENDIFNKLGVTGKSPRAARAFKFSPKQATTRVLDIKIQVGRTGAITPIALLEPVEIDGVTITRATLHNQGEMKRLGIKINDTVVIERAGDVIPIIFKVLFSLRTGNEKNFRFPEKCPNCSTKLIKPLNEAVWRCLNQKCFARKKENLHHFVSKKAFNIEGMGPKIIDKLIEKKLIFSASDIFTLRKEDLFSLENFGEKSAQNLIEAIKKSKEVSLAKFIFSLGVRHLGEETASDLAKKFNDVNRLKKALKQEIELISGIGPKTAQSIYDWFQSEKKQKLIDDLFSAGVKIKKIHSLHFLQRKTFVLTGSLATITREQAQEKIRLLGGKVSNTVSQKTSYLVIGKRPGSKVKKAEKIGVKIIKEKEFLDLIKQTTA